ncbi:hypothetical protein MKW94_018851 [Papaver nudicaule]|uniref:Hexosyltransferase n=1 Tax=Papaver nudicaule TaxID=74823 RepID=A0AA42B3I2_PAPNU|nr:hypothetical protein [Papaver nudicaule]
MPSRWLVLASLSSISLLLYFLFLLFTLQIKSPFLLLSPSNSPISIDNAPRAKTVQFSLVIGILTRPDSYDRRHFLFVFCNLTKNEQWIFVALEILRFDDIVILNCTENMNSGKTYTYFSSLTQILPRRYDYVMKADDDVFIRLIPLASSLGPLPRTDMYYGFVIPCASQNPFVEYMSGMGFVLSWDLVQWITESSIPANNTHGPEDKTVGKWLKMGNKAKNRFSNKPAMYDYPGTNGKCSHELISETIAVHRLKRWDQWLDVLTFFNVTKTLKPSEMYHL